MNLVKEKVKCRECGKEGEIDLDLLETEQEFRIHWDGEGKEYFLCLSCEPVWEPDYSEEGSTPW